MTRIANHIRNNVVGYLALFVALGGTSYAAVSLPAGSVGTQQLRNGAVTGRKLANQAVTAASLDPKSIAGHIVAWAEIHFGNLVAVSNPPATVGTVGGSPAVIWHKRIPMNCGAIATPNDDVGSAVVQTRDAEYVGRSTAFQVQTVNSSGINQPVSFNIVVICP